MKRSPWKALMRRVRPTRRETLLRTARNAGNAVAAAAERTVDSLEELFAEARARGEAITLPDRPSLPWSGKAKPRKKRELRRGVVIRVPPGTRVRVTTRGEAGR